MKFLVAWCVFWLVAVLIAVPYFHRVLWFPEAISEHGKTIDDQFALSFVVLGILFLISQGIFGYAVMRSARRGKGSTPFWPAKPRTEFLVTFVVVGLFFVLDVTLSLFSEKAWANLYFSEPAPDAVLVEVTAEQFAWNVRYPGADGRFGKTDTQKITRTNPIGLDRFDEAAGDDVVTLGDLQVPIGRPIRIRLRSKDVLHSFWVPALRLKQDIVPGMAIELQFKVTKPGEYEIACAELCGLGHFRMKGTLTVVEQERFEEWLKEEGE